MDDIKAFAKTLVLIAMAFGMTVVFMYAHRAYTDALQEKYIEGYNQGHYDGRVDYHMESLEVIMEAENIKSE